MLLFLWNIETFCAAKSIMQDGKLNSLSQSQALWHHHTTVLRPLVIFCRQFLVQFWRRSSQAWLFGNGASNRIIGRRVIDYDAWVSIRKVPTLRVNELPGHRLWMLGGFSGFGSVCSWLRGDNCVAQSLHRANVLAAWPSLSLLGLDSDYTEERERWETERESRTQG